MVSIKFGKENLLLYAITPSSVEKSTVNLCRQVEMALKGGATCIQLREKGAEESEYIEKAVEIKKICSKYAVPLIINDNLTVALKSNADGVHLGKDDLSISQARKIAPSGFIIGATAKTVQQAQSAEKSGADYLGAGSVFASPTKKNAIRISKAELKEICSCVNIPVVAIGGIEKENICELAGCGIDGIATVSAVFSAKDIKKECEILNQIVKDAILK